MALIHYHAPQSRSFTIRWLFEELGSPPHELKVLNLKAGDHKKPDFVDINPMGKVPAIVHDGTVITESAAIALYLADLFPQAGLAPAIGDTARGTYLRWIIFNQACVEPAITDKAFNRPQANASTLPYGTYEGTVEALAGALAKGPYILGDRFSAADAVVGASVRWLLMFKLLPARSEFTNYVATLEQRPALQRAQAADAALAAAQA